MGGTWAIRVTATKAEKGLLQRSATPEQHPPQSLQGAAQMAVNRSPIPLHNMAAMVSIHEFGDYPNRTKMKLETLARCAVKTVVSGVG